MRVLLAKTATAVLVAVLIALAARVSFMLPSGAVPQSLQTVAVLGSVMLTGWVGVVGVVLYVVIGVAGLPIFADGGAGLSYALGPSAGYLVGFCLAALWLVFAARVGMVDAFIHIFLAAIVGHIVILVAGAAGLLRWLDVFEAWQRGFAPFSTGAVAKSLLLAVLVPLLRFGFRHFTDRTTATVSD
ncbi:MAG: biotin transporter BioY [Pseudomonadota bacterium]